MRKRDVRPWDSAHLRICVIAAVASGLVGSGPAFAEQPSDTMNACGCRSDSSGACYCERKAKCGCPGECEPKGCEEKRAKEMEKEVEIETKKAQEAERHKRPPDTEEERAAPPQPAHPVAPKPSGHPMSASDRRTLSRLLGVYVAQHPEARQMTVEDVLTTLAGPGEGKGH